LDDWHITNHVKGSPRLLRAVRDAPGLDLETGSPKTSTSVFFDP